MRKKLKRKKNRKAEKSIISREMREVSMGGGVPL